MREALLLTLFMLFNTSMTQGQSLNKYGDLAKEFLQLQQNGQFEKAYGLLDTAASRKLSLDLFKRIWTDQIVATFGDLLDVTTESEQKAQQYHVVIEKCRFSWNEVTLRFVFSGSDKILSFTVVNSMPAENNVDTAGSSGNKPFSTKDIAIRSDTFLLKARLTEPMTASNAPLAILIPGSGPQDMDLTVGANKVFRELAEKLSSNGIAVLRFNKRTLDYPKSFIKKSYTVDDEIVNDVISVYSFAKKELKYDGKDIFLVGHSLGGMLAPRIAERIGELGGIIIMAGNSRPLADIVIDQLNYLKPIQGWSDSLLRELKRPWLAASTINSNDIDVPADSLPGHIPASYWRDLNGYSPVKTAARLRIPMFILQGGRDYQVTGKDFDGWKKPLQDKPDILFRYYPAINHILHESAGSKAAGPSEYFIKGHIPGFLIKDIQEWILRTRRQ